MNKYQKQEDIFFNRYKDIQTQLENKRFQKFDLSNANRFLDIEITDSYNEILELSEILINIVEAKGHINIATTVKNKQKIMNLILSVILSIIIAIVFGLSSTASVASVLSASLVSFASVYAFFTIYNQISYNKQVKTYNDYLKKHDQDSLISKREKLQELYTKNVNIQKENVEKINSLKEQIQQLEKIASNLLECKKQMVNAENIAIETLGIDASTQDFNQHYKKDTRVNTIMRRSRKK